ADTWEWNGTAWRQVATTTTPPALGSPSLLNDFANGRILLTGSQLQGAFPNASWLFHVWSYDGTQWTQIATQPSVGGQQGVLQAQIDWLRSSIVAYDSVSVRDWAPLPATVTEIGAGCGSPPPRLLPRARPRLGATDAGLELLAAPGQLAVFAMS